MDKIYCFGNTEYGELGLGGIEEEHILSPRKLRLPYDKRKYSLIQISSGRNHTLLLLKNIQLDQNIVFSCGSNDRLQLGRQGSWKKLEPVDGLGHHNIIHISCGFNHCLALSEANQIFSWGCNLFGQLGIGTTEKHAIEKPSLVKSLASKQVIQICCGGNHCLALTKQGYIYSWGSNAFGQLGIGNSGNVLNIPTKIIALQFSPIRLIAAGGSHSAVLSCTGALYMFGKNEFGQLGLSDTKNRSWPTLQRSLRSQNIAYVSLGDEHSAALTFEGGLFTWGAGMYNQLGHGKNCNEVLPRKVFELMGTKITQVSCGRCHTLVASKLGRVWSFGLNGSGQLGINSTLSKSTPACVRGPWSELNIKDIVVRDGELSLQVVNEELFQSIHKVPDEESAPDSSNVTFKQNNNEIEIQETDEHMATENLDSFIIEEPDEESTSEDKHTTFVCASDTVFPPDTPIEIDEYDTDPSSDGEEGSERPQYIIKEIVTSKGDQSFIIVQPLNKNTSPNDFRKISPKQEILKLQNDILEKFEFISNDSLPLETIDYIENIFSSIPVINASYLSAIQKKEVPEEKNRIQKYRKNENVFSEELFDLYDGWINWPQAFHGFNMIEGIQNEKINELIYQNLVQMMQNLPDLKDSNVSDGEMMRVYQILPLFHMFKMTSYSEKVQDLIHLYSVNILKLSERGENCLKLWWFKMDRRYFKNLMEIYKNGIKIVLERLLQVSYETREQNYVPTHEKTIHITRLHNSLSKFLDMLNIIYKINKYAQKISYKEFYINGISEMVDLRKDYTLWKKNRYTVRNSSLKEYYLCNFPFIFDSPAKNVIISIETQMQQEVATSLSIQKQILMSRPTDRMIMVEPYLTISVNRKTLLEDTLRQMSMYSQFQESELKKPLKVAFVGEEALDAGQGMKKEFFLLLMKELLDEKYGMFVQYEETATIWFNHANPNVAEDDFMYNLIGILCGLAIYNTVIIDLPFPLVLYKKILDEDLHLEDLAYLDPLLTKNLSEILTPSYGEEEFNAIFGEITFTITLQSFGSPVEYELCPGGKDRILKYENREEYVKLYWEYLLINSIAKQFNSFYIGFTKVIDKDILHIFQAEELMQMVEGEDVVRWEELEEFTSYKHPFHRDHRTIRAFWKVFNNFSIEDKKKFLNFLTGSDRIPVTGMKTLKFIIQPMDVSEEHLPVAHTCFNVLDLPLEYKSENIEDKMRTKLLKAIEMAGVGFALA